MLKFNILNLLLHIMWILFTNVSLLDGERVWRGQNREAKYQFIVFFVINKSVPHDLDDLNLPLYCCQASVLRIVFVLNILFAFHIDMDGHIGVDVKHASATLLIQYCFGMWLLLDNSYYFYEVI